VELSLLRDNRLSELAAFSQSNVLFGIILSWPISWPWYYVFVKACEVGFAVDVVQQELSGGCPTSRKP